MSILALEVVLSPSDAMRVPPVLIHLVLAASSADERQQALGDSVRSTVFTADGRLVASNKVPPHPPLAPADLARLARERVFPLGGQRVAVGEFAAGELVGYGIVDLPLWSLGVGLAIASAALLLGSILFARTLLKPLRRLQRTALAFGAGDLSARTGLPGRNEVEQTAAAFDAMADRISRLMRSQRELLANVAHELRTPLARIRMALDLAHEGDDVLARSILTEIDRDLGDLEHLVADVLTSSRLDLAPWQPRTESVDIRAMLGAIQDRAQAWRDGREVVVEIDDTVTSLDGDRALLTRALGNLVDNARAYSDPTTPITICASYLDGVVFEVIDRGIGIHPSDLPHVFEEFFRAERSRSRDAGGSGLGLVLAKKIVAAHHGTISIASRLGEGTTVRIQLPPCTP